MNFLRYLLLLVVASCTFAMATPLMAQPDCCLRRRDFEVVEEFLNSKRTIDLCEKSCNLTIAGEVRFAWNHLTEKEFCNSIRGGNNIEPPNPIIPTLPRLPISKNEFDCEFDLFLDYVCDRAWGVAWLEFLNKAGVERRLLQCVRDPSGCGGSGFCDGICMKKAYVGYNVWCDGDSRFDIELGRRPLWTVFDSYIQFQERFDGLLLKFSTSFECWVDWYVNAGAFVIDERVNHFGYIIETGFMNIADIGLDFKYSFVNWAQHGHNRCLVNNALGWEFRNSQWTLAYNLNPELFCDAAAQVYGAVLFNHAAKRSDLTNGQRKGLGWYVGFLIGEVRLEGDWSLDITYEEVEARAVSDCDVSGIGRGNVYCESFTINQRGNNNFKGWRFEGLYALTDNLTLDTIIEFSRAADKRIGGQHSFSRLELAAIYAF